MFKVIHFLGLKSQQLLVQAGGSLNNHGAAQWPAFLQHQQRQSSEHEGLQFSSLQM